MFCSNFRVIKFYIWKWFCAVFVILLYNYSIQTYGGTNSVFKGEEFVKSLLVLPFESDRFQTALVLKLSILF